MSTFYLDYENGNDLHGGDSFAVTATAADMATNGTGSVTSASAAFDSSLIGRYISICNGSTLLGTYVISAVPSGTSLTVVAISGGTATSALVTGSNRTYYIGGRWKTLTTGASAARLVAGDTIRIMASPDPTSLGQSANWTNLSKNVELTSAVTQNVDDGEAAWTASANVTATADTTQFKENTKSAKLVIAAGFTTGLAAYKSFASTDFSGKQQLSFWIRNSVAIPASSLSIKLCSDAAGATPVNAFTVPAIPTTNRWVPVTVDLGSAMGAAIQSVALYVDSDFGAVDIYLDNLIACKAPSAADSLTLTSMIGKNSGSELWWGIQSINGTTVKLDNLQSTLGSDGAGYAGTTETVTTWKREGIKVPMTGIAGSTHTELATQDSGTASGGYITFSGGWNRTDMSTQTGETWFFNQSEWNSGVDVAQKQYVKIEKLNFQRFTIGLRLANSSYAFNIVSCATVCCSTGIAITANGPGRMGQISCVAGSVGLILSGIGVTVESYTGLSHLDVGLRLTCVDCVMNSVTLRNNAVLSSSNARAAVLAGSNATNNVIRGFVSSDNMRGQTSVVKASTGSVDVTGTTIFVAPTFSESTLFGFSQPGRFIVLNYGGTSGDTRIWANTGTSPVIQAETTVVHTIGGKSWKISPNSSTIYGVDYPLLLPLTPIAVNANALVTITAWLRRTNTAITGMLVVRGGQIAGVANDVTASMTAAADTWEQVQLQFTPTEAGVVELEVWAYGGTTHSVYVDDVEVSQA